MILDYQITDQIYESSHSLIYRAKRNSDKTSYILKMLKKEYPTLDETARFRREYEITRKLDIDGVVKPIALEEYKNTLFMVLEDFNGDSLAKELEFRRAKKEPMELYEFLKTALQISKILGHVHRQFIIHKDINPSNLIWNQQTDQIQIIDFGGSTELSQEKATIADSDVLEGTLFYISPEQTGRMNREIDYRTDMYSLGVTFYEMLTGQLPFQTDDLMKLIHCHMAINPPPPHAINPAISKTLSTIVLKLMAKAAEDRYQSMFGLKHDLQICLESITLKRTIETFVPGQKDVSDRFQIPQKLYGREEEVKSLLAAFDRVARNHKELMLVSGYSGQGKSSLVHEIHKPITEKRGYFIHGKFDRLGRSIPYASLIQAFRELVQQLLTESSEKIALWKHNILQILHPNAQLVINVIPELELIIGPQPEVQELPVADSKNRFNRVLQNFVNLFAKANHPLVIFLDDLQWADTSSLNLIQLLMNNREVCYLLLIGAFRDNEVGASHPLTLALEDMEKAGNSLQIIHLYPLNELHVNQLIEDTLHTEREKAEPLADLVFQKTQGNPFFVNRFLKSLHEERLLKFDQADGEWKWNMNRIQEADFTDNVVDLMAGNIEKLPKNTHHVVSLAASIGSQFSLDVLAIVCQQQPLETFSNLWTAIQRGLIRPIGNAYQWVTNIGKDDIHSIGSTEKISFSFLHDRVHQAAYSLIPESEKESSHYRIGKLLLSYYDAQGREENIFDIVNHLNIGIKFVIDSVEKEELARLNLSAGKKAKESIAHEAASRYFSAGLDLLEEDCWKSQYDLASSLNLERGESEYLCGNFEKAEFYFNVILEQARSNMEKFVVFNSRIILYTNQTRYEDAVRAAIEGLKLFGVHVPFSPGKYYVRWEILKSRFFLHGRKASDLLETRSTNPETEAIMILMLTVGPAALYVKRNLLNLFILKLVNQSLKHGNTKVSALAYVTYGMIVGSVLGDLKSGFEFGKMALELNERFNDISLRSKINHIFALWSSHWRQHARKNIDYCRIAIQSGMEAGDQLYTCYAASVLSSNLIITGELLPYVYRELNKYYELVTQANYDELRMEVLIYRHFVSNLLGETLEKKGVELDGMDEKQLLELLKKFPNKGMLTEYHLFKIQYLFLMQKYMDGYNIVVDTGSIVERVFLGHLEIAEYYFYASLTLIAIYPSLPKKERKTALKRLKKYRKKLKKWSENCEENFQHKHMLVEAEFAHLKGKKVEAIAFYENAMMSAKKNSYIQNEAIANELAAGFYYSIGHTRIAEFYHREAIFLYKTWGATTKVEDMEQKHPNLIRMTSSVAQNMAVVGTGSTSISLTNVSDTLDISTVTKASQAISGEIRIEKLLEKLIGILIENAGAQRGIIFLERDGELYLEAEQTTDSKTVQIYDSIPITACDHVSTAIINYVKITEKSIVVNDATQNDTFSSDPYILKNNPRSILCIPVMRQSALMGILYLENNISSRVFTNKRIELLGILLTQAAISLENARLFEEQIKAERELKRHRDHLEEMVTERTSELKKAKEFADDANHAKSDFLANISHEIRNPIHAILGFTKLGLKKIQTISPEKLTDYLNEICQSGERLLDLINNLLDLSKLENRQTDYLFETESLSAVIKNVISEFNVLAGDKNIKIMFNTKISKELNLIDKKKIRQVLVNLLSNAIKFSPDNKMITIAIHRGKDKTTVSMMDQGVGIPEDERENIFNKFIQSSQTKTGAGGTGLGLSICKQIIADHKGEIWAENNQGEGSTFRFTLPS